MQRAATAPDPVAAATSPVRALRPLSQFRSHGAHFEDGTPYTWSCRREQRIALGCRGMDACEAFRARCPGDRACRASPRLHVAWPARRGAAAVMMPREQLDDR